MLNVHGADVDDHTNIGPGNIGQVCNFPEMIHAHFQHSYFDISIHSQHSHGHTNVIIVIHRSLAYPVFPAQHSTDHFLGGAFAHRSGDTHHLCAQTLPLTGSDQTQSNSGILHNDGRIISLPAAAQHRCCALFQCRRDKVMSIPGALQCHKQLSGLNVPGVVGRTQEGNVRILGIDLSTAPLCGLLQRNAAHVKTPFLSGAPQPLPVHPDGTSHR